MKQEDFVIHSCALTWELLQENPVWTDADEADSGMIRPVNSSRPFETTYGTLTLKAHFITSSGRKLFGSVVYSSTFERVYLIEVFAGGEAITFHRSLASLVPQQLERLHDLLAEPIDPIFPIEFMTDVNDKHGKRYCGIFDPRGIRAEETTQ